MPLFFYFIEIFPQKYRFLSRKDSQHDFSTKKSGCSYLPHTGIVAAQALNFRVRHGIGCVRRAIAAAMKAVRQRGFAL